MGDEMRALLRPRPAAGNSVRANSRAVPEATAGAARAAAPAASASLSLAEVSITKAVTNMYGAAHGAALAALMGSAAETAASRDDEGGGGGGSVRVRSCTVDYISAVRAKSDAEIAVRLVSGNVDPGEGGHAEDNHAIVAMVELRSTVTAKPSASGRTRGRPVLARAKVVLQRR